MVSGVPTCRVHFEGGKTMKRLQISLLIFSILMALPTMDFAEEGTWTKVMDMPTPRAGHAAAVVKGKIYVIGGATTKEVLSSVEEYDPMTSTWTPKADMPTGRWSSAGCVVNGKIYVIGGTNAVQNPPPLSTLEVYDPGTDESINPEGKLPTTWGNVRTVMKK